MKTTQASLVVDLDKKPIKVDDRQEQYPQLVYDPIRHDVHRYLEEKAPALALSIGEIAVRRLPDESGYTGVFIAGSNAFWYVMTGKGFKYKGASDQDNARKAFDSFLQRELLRSKVIRQHEAVKDFAILLDLGKSSRKDQLRFKRSVGVDFVLGKSEHSDACPARPGFRGVCHCGVGPGVHKALPKGDKETPVKKTKTTDKAASKKQGAGGRTRYTYPTEKGKPGAAPMANGPKTKRAGTPQAMQKEVKPREQVGGSKPQPQPDPVQTEFTDPAKFARLIRVDIMELRKLAAKFQTSSKKNGREKFVHFMTGKLKNLADKHNLDAKYFGLVYDALVSMPAESSTKAGG